ncbi:NADPH dehydrogenase NamA [Sporosarcina ureilytica]|nr:NADPH dehydrogenase NamA [Sporosarcina ureilytica]
MSPMCMNASFGADGYTSNWHQVHYASRAMGGVGLVMIESTAVNPNGRIKMHDIGIWDDKFVPGLRTIVDAVHDSDSKIAVQLAHAGRKALVDGSIIGPSPLPFQDDMKMPIEMTVEMIKDTIEEFKQATIRSKEAGFDVIELHGAHGYLINQFLSPLSNKRTDEYGGSRENRFRFLKEIIKEVRSVWDQGLFVRISADEYHPEGNTMDDFVYFSEQMKTLGVDLIDCSSGAVVPAKIDVFPGYQVPLAEKIKKYADVPTGAVGLITDALQAEEIVKNNRADLVFLAREFLRDPYWPLRAAAKLGISLEPPAQYRRAWNEILPNNYGSVNERWYPGKEPV